MTWQTVMWNENIYINVLPGTAGSGHGLQLTLNVAEYDTDKINAELSGFKVM